LPLLTQRTNALIPGGIACCAADVVLVVGSSSDRTRRRRGCRIAFVNSFGNLGGLVGPYAPGALEDATGSTTGALLGLAMMALAAGVLCLVLRRRAAVIMGSR